MNTRKTLFAALSAFALLAAAPALSQDDIRTEIVHFKHGESGATIEGRITGYETVDYVLGASAGQTMNVSMATRHGATYFNILPPGSNDVAIHVGSSDGNQFEGALAMSGDYKVRVYMMRSAARRNEVADYRLEMTIAASGGGGGAPSNDAKVPGTDFHATGEIDCSMGAGAMGTCPFGVIRRGNGDADVHVTKPDGSMRVIFFEGGKATGADLSQADMGAFSAEQQDGQTIVRIGEERYEIFEAVVYGG